MNGENINHTHEPWPNPVDERCGGWDKSSSLSLGLLDYVDYNRARVCVNACAGIPTEKLEGKTIADYVAGEAYLKGMEVNNGSLEIDINGLPCQLLAASFAGQFVGSGAENFLTIDMKHESIGDFTVTMQRSSGTTSANKLAELKDECARLSAQNLELVEAIEIGLGIIEIDPNPGRNEKIKLIELALAKAKEKV